MEEQSHRKLRIVAVVAATFISLACGTNYAYSAWAPQFADRMQLSATQSNLIGSMGNLGMYASGIPLGYMVDTRGPRPGVLVGSLALGLGYYPIKRAWDGGPGSISLPALCFFSFLTGFGSSSAFSASIKTAALNWPLHRGTATSFPAAAFGLSAVFFTTISHLFLGDDTGGYLLLLSIGTVFLTLISFFFIYVPQPEQYHRLATGVSRVRSDSTSLERAPPWRLNSARPRDYNTAGSVEHSRVPTGATTSISQASSETASLLSEESVPGDVLDGDDKSLQLTQSHHSLRPDVSGLTLFGRTEFYSMWLMLGILTGIGLMTINNIGTDVRALWYGDKTASPAFVAERQLMHVSIISMLSFTGRLLSGMGSDFLVKRMHVSRFWCLVCSSSIFTLAQISATLISDPHYLWVLSSLTGLAYGALFGVYPALTADTFGVSGLSMNWGFLTLAPVVSGNIFNLGYGMIYDSHARILPDGSRVCEDGLQCYRGAYVFSFFASLVGIMCALWCVWHEGYVRRKEEQAQLDDHEA